MADAASSKVKVAALKKTRLDIVNLFDQDMRDGHPGSGRAEIAFGTWRRDDGRVRDQIAILKAPRIRSCAAGDALLTLKCWRVCLFTD